MSSPIDDVSVALPSTGYVVDNEDHAFRLYYSRDDLFISVSIRKDKDAIGNLKTNIRFLHGQDGYAKVVERDGYLIALRLDDDPKKGSFSTSIDLASRNGSYSIFARSKKSSAEPRKRFLQAIRLGSKTLFTSNSTFPDEAVSLTIASLKTDEIVLEALKAPDSKQSKLERERDAPKGPDEDQIVYSRSIITLRKPRPSYTDRARMNNVNGTVVLRATFRADGTIGPVYLVSSLDRDLDEQAFKAAKRIKFLPAELNKRPVDSLKKIEYTFTIY